MDLNIFSHFADKDLYSQSYVFFTPVVMYRLWELDHMESWVLKNWYFWTVVLEKTLESLLDCKDIKPANPKGSQRWIFTGRTDAEAEGPILWPPDSKSQVIGKAPDAGKDWGEEEKRATRMRWLDGNVREDEQTAGDSEGQGNLEWFSPWGHRARHN